ncbi:MAG: ABC transporter permease [Phycisphaerae bacterium]|nr:ABC transporter permease [Phycisphaerae bacterium]
MSRILTAAIREFKSTALTKAFFLGAIVFPVLIWTLMIGVTSIKFPKPPVEGTFAVIDRTNGGKIGDQLATYFDPEQQRQRLEKMKAQIEAARKMSEQMGMGEQFDKGVEIQQQFFGESESNKINVEVLPPDADEAKQRERINSGEIIALAVVDEKTMALSPAALRLDSGDRDDDKDQRRELEKLLEEGPGSYAFFHGTKLRPDHSRQLKTAVENMVRDERFRRAGMEPNLALALSRLPVQARSVVVTPQGEKKSNDALTLLLPFIFMMLIYISAMTGGQYLMMGTLEEKSSRVMEVILSAISPRELLIGKLVGQGLVGLAVLAIYGALGFGIASRFGTTAQIPMSILPWALLYFLMAYALIGSMMLAVGSAVTEIREAQALYTPITIMIILPFLLMMPIMQNPGGVIARVFSYFPLTTPYVMVMRLAQPSHVVPLWELVLTSAVGLAGVAGMIWIAAKIFRVGVLMYGKPPSLMELVKWVRLA